MTFKNKRAVIEILSGPDKGLVVTAGEVVRDVGDPDNLYQYYWWYVRPDGKPAMIYADQARVIGSQG